jgi:Ala-tRNA(Pro) deacylase
MLTSAETLCLALRESEIPFARYDHPPVATCEEAAIHLRGVEGAGSKNLFLRNKKGDRHFLITVHEDKRVDLLRLSELLGAGRLGFASAERLERYLGVKPGAVTILALVNDTAGAVIAYIDKELWEAPSIQCHPMENTATLVISPQDIARFVGTRGRSVVVLDVPVAERGASPG